MSLRATGWTALAVFVVDRASKWWVVEAMDLRHALAIDVAPGLFHLRMAWNRGVNFGLFASGDGLARWGFVALALTISAGVAVWAARRGERRFGIGAGLLIGGALGNAWDRAQYGAVADFLNVTCCGVQNPYSFNVADAAIMVGALTIALLPSAARSEA